MKNIITNIVAGLALAFTVSAQTPTNNPPDSLPIGKMGVLQQLASAKMINARCLADDKTVFSKTFNLPSVQSLEDVKTAIDAVEVSFPLEDPTAQYVNIVTIYNGDGYGIFEAETWFKLQEKYEDGKVKHEAPEWARDVYFRSLNPLVDFPGVQEAYLIDRDGNEYELDVWTEKIEIENIDSGFLKIVTGRGIYYYDFNTGFRITETEVVFDNFDATFRDFRSAYLYDGVLNRTLAPEYGYVPWLEVKVPASGMIKTGSVSSLQGYSPIGVWSCTLDQMRQDSCPLPIAYSEGMIISAQPGSVVYLWFDFEEWVWGSGNYGGKG